MGAHKYFGIKYINYLQDYGCTGTPFPRHSFAVLITKSKPMIMVMNGKGRRDADHMGCRRTAF